MEANIKNFAIFLPLLGAMLYGLGYAFAQQFFIKGNTPTYIFYYYCILAPVMIGVSFLLSRLLEQPIAQLRWNDSQLWLLLGLMASFIIAQLTTIFSMKYVSAVYASVGEIAYPIFTIFFSWLLFRNAQLTMPTIIGGVLIFAGSAVLVVGKIMQPSPQG